MTTGDHFVQGVQVAEVVILTSQNIYLDLMLYMYLLTNWFACKKYKLASRV